MIRARVVIEGDLQEFVGEVRDASRNADSAMKKDLDKIAKAIQGPLSRDLMALTPGRVRYPIQWTSEKQRRAYFATDGFGKGIPYKRKTGKRSLMGGWQVRKYVSKSGNLLTASNDIDIYKYVAEDPNHVNAWQRFHRRTGWPSAGQVDEIFAAWSDVAQQQLGEMWFQYWDKVMK